MFVPFQIRAEKPLFSSNPELDNLVSVSHGARLRALLSEEETHPSLTRSLLQLRNKL